MQQMKKRDTENVIICPRCGAKNLSSQKRCGKCGYVFPAKEIKKGQKMDIEPFSNATGMNDNTNNAPQEIENEQEHELQIPKSLMTRAKSEGHLRSIAIKTICSICGAQNSPHSKRCIKCGKKFVEKKK